MTPSAGWDWIAPLVGIVTVTRLIVGRRRRSVQRDGCLNQSRCGGRRPRSLAGSSVGVAPCRLGGDSSDPTTTYLAAIAVVGRVAALVPLGNWLHSGDPEPRL